MGLLGSWRWTNVVIFYIYPANTIQCFIYSKNNYRECNWVFGGSAGRLMRWGQPWPPAARGAQGPVLLLGHPSEGISEIWAAQHMSLTPLQEIRTCLGSPCQARVPCPVRWVLRWGDGLARCLPHFLFGRTCGSKASLRHFEGCQEIDPFGP